MKKIHEKSPCCGEKIYAYNNRRRQCRLCERTWRVWRRKRGRNKKRIDKRLLIEVFLKKKNLSQIKRKRCSYETLRKRFSKALNYLIDKKEKRSINSFKNDLIVIIDALWFLFLKKRYTLYLVGVKQTNNDKVYLLDFLLEKGKENYQSWVKVFQSIPNNLRKKIKAFVSDNFAGSKRIALKYNLIHQLCHFHLIKQLQIRRGKRRALSYPKTIIEKVYFNIQKGLKTKDENHFKEIKNNLLLLTKNSKCPRKIKMIVNEFLRRKDEFQAYLIYPSLNLPRTTNTIES